MCAFQASGLTAAILGLAAGGVCLGLSQGIASAAELDVTALQERMAVRWENVPRKVLAFYYPWYGTPEVTGRWRHYNNVDVEGHSIGSMTHYPSIGPFDSHDPKVIAYHMELAERAGVDGMISSWWVQGDFHDQAMPLILEAAEKQGIEVTVYYERVPRPGEYESAVDDFLYILRQYGAHPAFLKVQGKPVIFVYGRAMGQLGMADWAKVLTEVNERHPDGLVAIADRFSRAAARVFDGLHIYNCAGSLRDAQPDDVSARLQGRYADAVGAADAYGRISSLTVIPGYDDTKIREPGLNVRRFDGRLYEALWEMAIECDPHWVLITSWNEWHEGSEIEPSLEYGEKYIELTARFAERFKQGPRAARPVTAAGLSPERLAAVRRSLQGQTFGLLPDASSEAPFWLMEVGADVRPLSWEQVLDPAALDAEKLPALIYACGENYVQSVRAAQDVDEALVRYLHQGGLLISMASLPYPFFRTVEGEIVVTSARFGLPLAVGQPSGEVATAEPQASGFEAPPTDVTLTFHVDTQRLKGLPERIPFPKAGDRRWRPFLGRSVPNGNTYVPLIELRDEQGRWWGDAVAYVEYRTSEPKGGRVLYVWFGLLNMPIANELLASTFEFLADVGS